MSNNGKRFSVLIQETINQAVDKSTVREDFKAGTRIPVIQWKNGLTNTGKETANGSHFLYEDVQAGIEKRYFKKRFDAGKLYCEFRHPSRVDPERYCMVDEGEASDRIIELEWREKDGGKWLVGLCETATFAKGPALYEMIMSGAIPSKSLRASGEIWTDETGRSRKDLMIMCWDNVFIGADEDSWGIDGTYTNTYVNRASLFKESMYPDKVLKEIKMSLDNINKDRDINKLAMKCWMECSIDSIAASSFKDIDKDIKLIGESETLFKPNKVLVDSTGREIVYISESTGKSTTMVKTDIAHDFKGDILSFFKSKI